MGRRKHTPDRAPEPEPVGRKPTAPISARVPPKLAEEFNAAVAKIRPKTSASAVVEMLIEQWLASGAPPAAEE